MYFNHYFLGLLEVNPGRIVLKTLSPSNRSSNKIHFILVSYYKLIGKIGGKFCF